jgi:hypothetical protein
MIFLNKKNGIEVTTMAHEEEGEFVYGEYIPPSGIYTNSTAVCIDHHDRGMFADFHR